MRLRRRRWRRNILLLLRRKTSRLRLLLRSRWEACGLRLLEARVLGLLQLALLLLRRIASRLRLQSTGRETSILLLQWLWRLLLAEPSGLLRLEGRGLALEASLLGL